MSESDAIPFLFVRDYYRRCVDLSDLKQSLRVSIVPLTNQVFFTKNGF